MGDGEAKGCPFLIRHMQTLDRISLIKRCVALSLSPTRPPIPSEIADSVSFFCAHSDSAILCLCRAHLRRRMALVRAAGPLQDARYPCTPADCRSETGSVNIAAHSHSTDQGGVGGKRWIRQFVCSFDIVGAFSQSDLFPTCRRIAPLVGST